MAKWAPRTGRTAAYDEWEHALHQLCIMLRVSYKALPVPPPTLESVAKVATRKSAKAQEELEEAFLLEYQDWLTLNTAIYMVVERSLVLDGAWG